MLFGHTIHDGFQLHIFVQIQVTYLLFVSIPQDIGDPWCPEHGVGQMSER